jgi:hypothetical protein
MHQYFVNALTGVDSNPGTSASPFKTITRALSLAVSGDTVFVKPGTYDAANGETFPLQVPAGVSLIGDEPNRGAGTAPTPTKINGGSTASLSLGSGAIVAGFSVTCAASNCNGITAAAAPNGTMIRNNTLNGSGLYGIYITNGTNHRVVLNTGSGNAFAPLTASGTSVTAKVENNTFTSNGYGVELASSPGEAIDLGGGVFSSVGNNVISCNSTTDLWENLPSGILSATNNKWDHTPPTTSTSATNGIDVYVPGPATVTTTGATLAPNPCPACSGSAVSSQVFDGIMIGCGGAVSFANRATLCPSYCHVCSPNEWVSHHGTLAPAHNYWTSDLLGYSNTSPICLSVSGPNFCSSAGEGPGGVCAPTQPDPEGNNCINPNHALCPDTTNSPNQFFGACNGMVAGVVVDRSGALCCCP